MTATRFAKASTLVALAVGWLVGRVAPQPDDRAGRPARRRTSTRARSSRPTCCTGARATTASCAGSGWRRRSSRWPRSRCSSYLGPRIARAWELGRVATGIMVGAVTTLGVWAVGLPFGALELWWGRRYGLERSGYAGVGVRAVAGAARPGRRPDDRAHRPAAARGALRPALVARRRAAVRRRSGCCSCSCCRGWRRSARGRRTTRPPPRRIRQLAQGRGRRRHAGPDRGGARPDDGRERDGDRDRALGARLHLGHVPRRPLHSNREIEVVAAHEFGHIAHHHIWKGLAWSLLLTVPGFWLVELATRRRGGLERPEVVPLALLVLALIGLADHAARERRLAPLRGRGRLVGAARDPRPGGGRERLPQVQPTTTWCSRTRRSGRTSGSTTTRRSCSGSRWPAPTRRAGAKSRCRGGVSGRFRIPSRDDHFDHESCIASSSSRMNRVDMFTRATTTPGTSPSSTSWSIRANVIVNS